MLTKASGVLLVLLVLNCIPKTYAQTSGEEREIDGVVTDTCCWCGPRPTTCKAKDSDPKAKVSNSQSQHSENCINSCVRNNRAHYVIAPPDDVCPQASSAGHGYVLDDKYNNLAAQYAGKMVHLKGIFDESNHEVQVASIEPADSPGKKEGPDVVAHNEGFGWPGKVRGWVVDDKCGAKGANDKAEACTKKCLAAGAKMVIVTDKDQKILMVDNPDALKGHEGHHIAATGHVMGDSIHVESAKML
ncbi:MAG TPA: hypothetical protein VNY51_06980 [Candidatus Dormibacteraeota bacterium]|nr:hypothetical protein [Candidatus Dormibacteraeota bacterium]